MDLWDIHQYRQIAEVQTSATKSARDAQDAKSDTRELKRRLEKLMLINMALWSLLKDVSDLTEEDLEKRIMEIDLADGQMDGKVRNQAEKCTNCNRVISAKHSRCLYCGQEVTGQHGAFSDIL